MAKKEKKTKTLNVDELNLEAICQNAEEARGRLFPGSEKSRKIKRKRIFRKEAKYISR